MAGDTVEVPLSCLVEMFLALRLHDEQNPAVRAARCETAILCLPQTVRNKVVVAAAEQMRARGA